jgi:SAM-dependent methyltransferase
VLLCPDCRGALSGTEEACGVCGWSPQQWQSVPVFLSNRDLSNPLFADYRSNYDQIAEADLAESIQPEAFLDVQAERLDGHIGDVRGQRVCDVGVGKGILFERLRRAEPARLVGVDIAVEYLERVAREGAELMVANAENLPFRDEFDVVVAADVMEHVIHLADFLVSVREALVRGGRFVVRVPYREDITKHSRIDGCEYDLVHLRTFAKDNLTDVLRRAGFRVGRIHYDGFEAARARSGITATRLGRRLWHEIVERRFDGGPGLYDVDPRLGRLLMTPIAITAVASRR